MDEGNGGAGGCAQLQGGILTGGGGDGCHIRANLRRAVNLRDHFLHGDNIRRRADGRKRRHRLYHARIAFQHVHLLLNRRIADGQAQEKAIHLRFWQGICAHKFARILRRQHDKGLRHGVRHAIHRHLLLFHHFQQGGLRFGAGAVDFVRQHHLTHHRAFAVFRFAGLEVDQRVACHVGGHQVGGELDAPERAVQRFRQGAGERRLAHARHVLNQHMPPAQQRNQRIFDNFLLAHDNGADIVHQPLNHLPRLHTAPPLC